MADLSPSNPGLIYDPRNGQSAKFWAEVEKVLAKMPGAQTQRTETKRGLKPLPDPGRPVTANFPNPRLATTKGYAVRV